MSNVVPFRNPASPIAHFIRLGEAHKKFGELYAAGRLLVRRVVVEASRFLHQKEIIADLRRDGVEIVLDTQMAELAARSRYAGGVRFAPWASDLCGKPLGPEYFSPHHPVDVIGQIARFAVAQGVNNQSNNLEQKR